MAAREVTILVVERQLCVISIPVGQRIFVCSRPSHRFFFVFCFFVCFCSGYDVVAVCVYDGGSGYDSVSVCVYDGGSGYDLVGGCVYDG